MARYRHSHPPPSTSLYEPPSGPLFASPPRTTPPPPFPRPIAPLSAAPAPRFLTGQITCQNQADISFVNNTVITAVSSHGRRAVAAAPSIVRRSS
jgi:hypothetical protein